MPVDLPHWQARLDDLVAAHDVPGATLAIGHGGDISVVAAGLLNRESGVANTPDSVFQIGSVTKAYTAALVLRLVDGGLLDLDKPIVTYLPELRLADSDVAAAVTLRHLLSHTSGIDGDNFSDTGRGDDALERYVGTCAGLAQTTPLGTVMSYCNSGYCIAGRVVEKVTGAPFEAAMRSHLLDPLGATHSALFPEDVLRFRAAYGHVPGPDGQVLAPAWAVPRSTAPAGGLCARAADVVAFARMLASGGGGVLRPRSVTEMLAPHIAVPDRSFAHHWGLGLLLHEWDGQRVAGHDGGTVGQGAFLRFLPDGDLAVALLVNGGDALPVYTTLFAEVFAELADVRMPATPAPSGTGTPAGAARWVGRYDSVNIGAEVTAEAGGLRLTLHIGGLAAQALGADAFGAGLEYVEGDTWVGRLLGEEWTAATFFALPDGGEYLHLNGRALRKVAA